jgi:zinc protease
VATEHTADAVREILGEIERLQNEPVSAKELAETKSYLIGTFPYGTQTLEGISARLYDLAVFGLPEDYWATYPDAVAAVTAADIRRSAQQHLSADRIAVVAVGPEALLESGLKTLGAVKVI